MNTANCAILFMRIAPRAGHTRADDSEWIRVWPETAGRRNTFYPSFAILRRLLWLAGLSNWDLPRRAAAALETLSNADLRIHDAYPCALRPSLASLHVFRDLHTLSKENLVYSYT